MRGERGGLLANLTLCHGSSPHARGTRQVQPTATASLRIIPACAGNARLSSRTCGVRTDHPRMRGERDRIAASQCLMHGSSPHARGTPVVWANPPRHRRIIPACAGNAHHALSESRRVADHPRMRGERETGGDHRRSGGGSSPHARGTLRGIRQRRANIRIIPACAGNACPDR